jgi:hypothetical protein
MIPRSHSYTLAPEAIVHKLNQEGWIIGAHAEDDRCPAHATYGRHHAPAPSPASPAAQVRTLAEVRLPRGTVIRQNDNPVERFVSLVRALAVECDVDDDALLRDVIHRLNKLDGGWCLIEAVGRKICAVNRALDCEYKATVLSASLHEFFAVRTAPPNSSFRPGQIITRETYAEAVHKRMNIEAEPLRSIPDPPQAPIKSEPRNPTIEINRALRDRVRHQLFAKPGAR